jgi:putative FmdB family regulatory protein
MPRYTYKCVECEALFEKTHSMAEKLTDCEFCNSEKCLKRIPSSFRLVNGTLRPANNARPGGIVRDHIEEAQEDIKQQKEEMTKEYEP